MKRLEFSVQEHYKLGKEHLQKKKKKNSVQCYSFLTKTKKSLSAPVMIEIDGETDALAIANRELREKKIPLIIRRFMPDGTYEDWKVRDLIVD